MNSEQMVDHASLPDADRAQHQSADHTAGSRAEHGEDHAAQAMSNETPPEAAHETTHETLGELTLDEERARAITRIEHEFETLASHIRNTTRLHAHRVSEGMLPGAYKVFTTISRVGSITLSELTELLIIDKGQMSRMVRELDERGLITREPDPNDGRSMLLSLSDYGTKRLNAARGSQHGLIRRSLSTWSVADIDRFSELVHALAEGMQPTPEP